jgi:acyl-CoA thioesterase FadM
MSIESSKSLSAEICTTIRFPQVDAAQIIFYPRIFELISRYFPDHPLAVPPYAFEVNFKKPNRLGDEINIAFERVDVSSNWTFSGRIGDKDHFTIHSLAAGDAELAANAHRSGSQTFKTSGDRIGEWMSGPDGVMQLSRYFEEVCVAIEEWFEDTLKKPFYTHMAEQKIGIPTVKFTTRCRKLPRVGDVVSMWIRPKRLSTRSMTFTTWLVRDDECLIESEQVVVFVRLQPGAIKPVSIPDDLRHAFAAQVER